MLALEYVDLRGQAVIESLAPHREGEDAIANPIGERPPPPAPGFFSQTGENEIGRPRLTYSFWTTWVPGPSGAWSHMSGEHFLPTRTCTVQAKALAWWLSFPRCIR